MKNISIYLLLFFLFSQIVLGIEVKKKIPLLTASNGGLFFEDSQGNVFINIQSYNRKDHKTTIHLIDLMHFAPSNFYQNLIEHIQGLSKSEKVLVLDEFHTCSSPYWEIDPTKFDPSLMYVNPSNQYIYDRNLWNYFKSSMQNNLETMINSGFLYKTECPDNKRPKTYEKFRRVQCDLAKSSSPLWKCQDQEFSNSISFSNSQNISVINADIDISKQDTLFQLVASLFFIFDLGYYYDPVYLEMSQWLSSHGFLIKQLVTEFYIKEFREAHLLDQIQYHISTGEWSHVVVPWGMSHHQNLDKMIQDKIQFYPLKNDFLFFGKCSDINSWDIGRSAVNHFGACENTIIKF